MYSNCCCSCSFEAENIKIGQSSHKMYNNNILTFQESTTILNSCTKKSGNLLKVPRICIYEGVRGVMIIVEGNGFGDTSSNPGRPLIGFHIALIHLGKEGIRLFSLYLWVNSRTD